MVFIKGALLALVTLAGLLKGFRVVGDGRSDRMQVQVDFRWLVVTALVVMGMLVTFPSIGMVEAGARGVVLRFGAVTERVLPEGFYAVMPLADRVVGMDVQTREVTREASAASQDLQQVSSAVTLNYRLDPGHVNTIYQTLRHDALPRIIEPAIQEAIKAATAHYNAEQLITDRAAVKGEIESLITARLAQHHILVDTVNITDFDFSAAFNEAIEAKVRAAQEALRAENELARVRMEAQQKIEQAKAEAESLRLQRQEISPLMLQLRAIEVQANAVSKWDGRMPTTVWSGGGSAPVPVLDVMRNTGGSLP